MTRKLFDSELITALENDWGVTGTPRYYLVGRLSSRYQKEWIFLPCFHRHQKGVLLRDLLSFHHLLTHQNVVEILLFHPSWIRQVLTHSLIISSFIDYFWWFISVSFESTSESTSCKVKAIETDGCQGVQWPHSYPYNNWRIVLRNCQYSSSTHSIYIFLTSLSF